MKFNILTGLIERPVAERNAGHPGRHYFTSTVSQTPEKGAIHERQLLSVHRGNQATVLIIKEVW